MMRWLIAALVLIALPAAATEFRFDIRKGDTKWTLMDQRCDVTPWPIWDHPPRCTSANRCRLFWAGPRTARVIAKRGSRTIFDEKVTTEFFGYKGESWVSNGYVELLDAWVDGKGIGGSDVRWIITKSISSKSECEIYKYPVSK